MTNFNNIEIKQELRPCYAYRKKALFHLWIKKKDILQNEYVKALVESENGAIFEVPPDKIVFCDNKIEEYYFKENKEDKQ